MKQLGGRAKQRFTEERRGETIEREGQRVMAVRGGGVTDYSKPRCWRRALGCRGGSGGGFWATDKDREGEGLCL